MKCRFGAEPAGQEIAMTRQTYRTTLPKLRKVTRAGPWTVGNAGGEPFAVSSRCRHQLADLSKGAVDKDGCLVCPWHQSRYDVRTGAMVTGPRGFLLYRGPTPGYSQLVLAYGRRLRLRIGTVVRRGDEVEIS
jgi:nitrite reductase/ring-hydroxylating ferredoxin subunit